MVRQVLVTFEPVFWRSKLHSKWHLNLHPAFICYPAIYGHSPINHPQTIAMRSIAHRGFAEWQPENTLTAIQQAADQADMIELDVRRCGSDELVIIHHEIVGPVSNESGPVSEFSATELANLNIRNSDDGVPTLTDALETVPDEIDIILDLKEAGIAADVIAATRSIENDVLLSALDADVLAEARQVAPTFPLKYCFYSKPKTSIDTAIELDCTSVGPHWVLCLTTNVVDDAHEAGLDVYAWPVKSGLRVQALEAVGADGIFIDHPAVVGGSDLGGVRTALYQLVIRLWSALYSKTKGVPRLVRIGAALLIVVVVFTAVLVHRWAVTAGSGQRT